MTHTGGTFLECPVDGTIKPALDCAMVDMAAGDCATFDRVRPLLDEISSGSMWV